MFSRPWSKANHVVREVCNLRRRINTEELRWNTTHGSYYFQVSQTTPRLHQSLFRSTLFEATFPSVRLSFSVMVP